MFSRLLAFALAIGTVQAAGKYDSRHHLCGIRREDEAGLGLTEAQFNATFHHGLCAADNLLELAHPSNVAGNAQNAYYCEVPVNKSVMRSTEWKDRYKAKTDSICAEESTIGPETCYGASCCSAACDSMKNCTAFVYFDYTNANGQPDGINTCAFLRDGECGKANQTVAGFGDAKCFYPSKDDGWWAGLSDGAKAGYIILFTSPLWGGLILWILIRKYWFEKPVVPRVLNASKHEFGSGITSLRMQA